MTFRQSNSSSNNRYSKPKSRLNQQIRSDSTDEGCPVMEESGTICGETDTFDVFQEFRKIYEDCITKLEGTEDGNAILRKLAPFKKLIDDLWEQNTMLVETVEELEQEATCRVTNLQDKLKRSCQKICECKEDINALVRIIQSLCKNGGYNPIGLKLNTLCPASVFGACKKSSPKEDLRVEGESEMCSGECSFSKYLTYQAICKGSQKNTGTAHDCETTSLSSNFSDCSDSNIKNVRDCEKNNFSNKKCFIHSFNQNSETENDCQECDCRECSQLIKIHCNINKYSFNIGNLDHSECCDSSCMLNCHEADDH